MPFLAWWPGRAPANRVDQETMLSAVDLFPSLCRLAGAPLPAGVPFDGQDLSGAFLGAPARRNQPLYWEYGRNTNSFAFAQGRDRSPNVAVREGPWKLLIQADGSGAELYRLDQDASETVNVASEHADITTRLSQAALAWRRSLPGPPPVLP
jgi:arylsulfatase A-like enzyme